MLLYILACIIAILIIVALLYYLIPDIRSGAFGTGKQIFEPSNYENLAYGAEQRNKTFMIITATVMTCEPDNQTVGACTVLASESKQKEMTPKAPIIEGKAV